MSARELLDRLWRDYAATNPQAGAIHALLEGRGERVRNDHIALRTFARAPVGLEALAAPFVASGYAARGDYDFPTKRLTARHYEHPEPDMPKVFVSELRVDELSDEARAIVEGLVAQVPAAFVEDPMWPAAGRPWAPVSSDELDHLAADSEYAAWMAVFGFCANHFTVDVNALTTFGSLEELDELLVEHGFELNTAGGAIKGSPDALLEQSSTLASAVTVELADGPREVPGCYYEFARRYRRPDGSLFQGFVAASADRLFESTNRR